MVSWSAHHSLKCHNPGDEITAVETSSNDLPVCYEAFEWVSSTMPELIEKPCEGYFDGGSTPGDCARAVTEGYALFAAGDDFSMEK